MKCECDWYIPKGLRISCGAFFWVQEMESSAAGVSYRVKNLGGYDVYKRVSVTGSSTEERKAE